MHLFRLSGLVWTLLFTVSTSAQSSFREELNLGVQAYKEAKYDDAIRHFQSAVNFDPQNEQAHLYLATAYAQQYIPGIESPDNLHFAHSAISEYQKVLVLNSQSMNSVKGIAYINLNMKRFEDSKTFYQKAISLDANDPENYYSVGVIDWTEAYTRSTELRGKLNKKPDESIINAAECWELRDANQAKVKEGIEMMAKAIELRPDYDDAMAYMNLLYRQKGDIDCSDSAAYARDMQSADHWIDLTLSAKKAKAEKIKQDPSSGSAPQR